MPEINLTNAQKDILIDKLQGYFEKELDQDIGRFDAEFLVDFIGKEFGAYYYNKGLSDARDIVTSQADSIAEAIYEIEQPI
ncbi:DUF2164 domain-containing protein [Leucothrix sargassi]|nr:DUF2164 domain-containing protein [Leucothrix sargassi]